MKYLKEEEKRDGNKVKDLKKIIRQLRASKILKDKETNKLNDILNNINKLKDFYLNKLKDIEYLYFNPIIKNNNDNKNCILRQLLCSEEDSTICIDENNFAFLPNKKNDDINRKINGYYENKSQPQTTKKLMTNPNENDMNVTYNDKSININKTIDYNFSNHKNNKNIQNLNYSSKKNYNDNYMNNNMFDSFDNSNEIFANNSNKKNMNVSNDFNNNSNINISNNITKSYNNIDNTTQMNNDSQTDTLSNFDNSNYNCNNMIKQRKQK